MKIRLRMLTALIAAITVTGCNEKDNPAPESSETSSSAQNPAARPSSASTTESVWMTDFEAAKARAAEEDKDLLMDFSGSDWCYWCKKLDGEVFSKPGFVEEAGKQFVFVKIDFPSDKSGQSRQLQAQNQRLATIYGIQGYPTVILAYPDGTPYARTGYQEGGPDAYLAHLEQLRSQR